MQRLRAVRATVNACMYVMVEVVLVVALVPFTLSIQ